MQTFKKALKKSTGDLETCLAHFLFMYQLTPHATTGCCPAELLFGRKPCTALDGRKVEQSQQRQKAVHDRHAEILYLRPRRQGVRKKNYSEQLKWQAGVVSESTGPLSVVVVGRWQ